MPKSPIEKAGERLLDLMGDDPLIEKLTDDVANALTGRVGQAPGKRDDDDQAWWDAKAVARDCILVFTRGMNGS